MTVLCPTCRKELQVPPDKVGLPGLKARCGGCGTAFAVSPPSPRPRPLPGPAWRRCATHPGSRSVGVCQACGRAWCPECVKMQGSALICPSCDTLCTPVAEQEGREARARRRARPLRQELATVFRYPLSDTVAFVLFGLVVGVFAVAASVAAFGGGYGLLFSQGLLYAYAFTAINRVSAGDLSSFMPNVSDVADLAGPLRVGLAALIVSSGPLLALSFAFPPQDLLASIGARPAAVESAVPDPEPGPDREPGEEAVGTAGDEAALAFPEEPAVPLWALGAFALALLWQLAYAPIALVAGAISRGFLSTLNPLTGLDAIRRMGSTYWEAMVVYTLITVVSWLVGAALALVPLAGRFLGAFVQSYAYLAIGCLLGLAVFKKAPELGLD